MKEHAAAWEPFATQWLEVMRKCGTKSGSLQAAVQLNAGRCSFGYVNVFTRINVGFVQGAALCRIRPAVQGMAVMRHVKLRSGPATNAAALNRLIDEAYSDQGSRRKTARLALRTALRSRRRCDTPDW